MMKRRVVQHGPSTLTISLPSRWIKEWGIKKGQELTIEPLHNGLFIHAGPRRSYETKQISVKGLSTIVTKAIAALYKYGYDEIIVEYGSPEELEKIHEIIQNGYIGYEIVDETKNTVQIRKVSEPQEEEFKTLFRRIFYFLLSYSTETLAAMKQHNRLSYEKLILRDKNIDKLADFCRRVVNIGGQTTYRSDTALYHLLEQLERLGDDFKNINKFMLKKRHACSPKILAYFEEIDQLLKEFERLFFNFSLPAMNAFVIRYKELCEQRQSKTQRLSNEDINIFFLLNGVSLKLYNLSGVTMMLWL